MQDYADEEGSRAAAGDFDAFRLRVFRPRPHGPEHGEQADGAGEDQDDFFGTLSHRGSYLQVLGEVEKQYKKRMGQKMGKMSDSLPSVNLFPPSFLTFFPLFFHLKQATTGMIHRYKTFDDNNG